MSQGSSLEWSQLRLAFSFIVVRTTLRAVRTILSPFFKFKTFLVTLKTLVLCIYVIISINWP